MVHWHTYILFWDDLSETFVRLCFPAAQFMSVYMANFTVFSLYYYFSLLLPVFSSFFWFKFVSWVVTSVEFATGSRSRLYRLYKCVVIFRVRHVVFVGFGIAVGLGKYSLRTDGRV